MSISTQLVLASASPRRKALLQQIGFAYPDFRFDILAADIDETHQSHESPAQFVLRLAQEKALAGLEKWRENTKPSESKPWVLGSDTIVVLGERILGKPEDAADAKRTLQALSGQTHRVMTAVALVNGSQVSTRLVETQVTFCALNDEIIQAYIATGEPMDKAGSYGIQALGGCFVASINGSYSAVVGLPLVETTSLLQEVGVL